MTEKEINWIIEKTVQQSDNKVKIERMQYIMDFGEVSVQYDFCLN